MLTVVASVVSLVAANFGHHAQGFSVADLERQLAALPNAASPVANCQPLLTLANRLIEEGSLRTQFLLEEYLKKQPDPVALLSTSPVLPSETWCQLLVVIPLLFEDQTAPRFAGAGRIPTYYQNGLILQIMFVYFPDEMTPRALRKSLHAVEWSTFRTKALALQPEKVTDGSIKRFLESRFHGYEELGHFIETMGKQNPRLEQGPLPECQVTKRQTGLNLIAPGSGCWRSDRENPRPSAS